MNGQLDTGIHGSDSCSLAAGMDAAAPDVKVPSEHRGQAWGHDPSEQDGPQQLASRRVRSGTVTDCRGGKGTRGAKAEWLSVDGGLPCDQCKRRETMPPTVVIDPAPVLRLVLRWTARLGLLVLLTVLVWQQTVLYRAQPVSTSLVPQHAPFPRLTLCPKTYLQDQLLVNESLRRTAAGTMTAKEFYNLTTLQLLSSEENRLVVSGRRPLTSPVTSGGPLGVWRQRYYLSLHAGVWPNRCVTFEPSSYLHVRAAGSVLKIKLMLGVAPMFSDYKGFSYRLYIHGKDEPNVNDLSMPEHSGMVPKTTSLSLSSEDRVHYVVTAKLRRMVSLRRRPCHQDPEYSLTQCLKECQWRRVTAHTGCRLPHMVGTGVFLPETRGPLDYLPPCQRPLFVPEARGEDLPEKKLIDSCWKSSCNFSRRCDSFTPAKGGLDEPANMEKLTSKWDAYPNGTDAIGDNEANTVDQPPSHHDNAIVEQSQTQLPPDLQASLSKMPFDEILQLGGFSVPKSVLYDLDDCQCLPPCNKANYHLSQKNTARKSKACNIEVSFFLDLATDQVEEELSFSMSTLLANFAGFIGMVTGFSLFTLAEVMETVLCAVGARWRARRQIEAEPESAPTTTLSTC